MLLSSILIRLLGLCTIVFGNMCILPSIMINDTNRWPISSKLSQIACILMIGGGLICFINANSYYIMPGLFLQFYVLTYGIDTELLEDYRREFFR